MTVYGFSFPCPEADTPRKGRNTKSQDVLFLGESGYLLPGEAVNVIEIQVIVQRAKSQRFVLDPGNHVHPVKLPGRR